MVADNIQTILWPKGMFEVLLDGQALGSNNRSIAAGENGSEFGYADSVQRVSAKVGSVSAERALALRRFPLNFPNLTCHRKYLTFLAPTVNILKKSDTFIRSFQGRLPWEKNKR